MQLPSDIAALQQEIEKLRGLLSTQEQQSQEICRQLALQIYENNRLKEKNAELIRKLYGRSSERRVLASAGGPIQGVLSLGESAPVVDAPRVAPTTVGAHTRTPSHRKRLQGEVEATGRYPEHLVRKQLIIDEGESAGRIISTKVTERLCVKPSQFYVEEITRVVRKHDDGSISQPPAPTTPFPRRVVDTSFLVHVILMKFMWHLPLYRQEQMLKAQGILISRDTLIRYVIDVGKLLSLLYDELLKGVFMDDHIFGDETPVLVGKGKHGNKKYTESRFWPFLGNNSIVFLFARTRAAKEIEPTH